MKKTIYEFKLENHKEAEQLFWLFSELIAKAKLSRYSIQAPDNRFILEVEE